MYDVLQTRIKETEDISFRLLGAVPLVNGAAFLTAVVGVSSSRAPAMIMLSLFGAVVTLGLFWWELRNIRFCLWNIALAEVFEEIVLGKVNVREKLRRRPPAPGNVGKRRAEKIVYSTIVFSWLALPIALLTPKSLRIEAWLFYGFAAVVVLWQTVRAMRTEVGLTNPDVSAALADLLASHGFRRHEMAQNQVGHLQLVGDFDGRRIDIMVDTGAASTVLDLNYCRAHNIEVRGTGKFGGGAGGADLPIHTPGNAQLTLDGLPVRSDGIRAIDLSHVNQELTIKGAGRVDAVLGADVLRHHQAVVDYTTPSLFLKHVPH
jgi:hypothetical protein